MQGQLNSILLISGYKRRQPPSLRKPVYKPSFYRSIQNLSANSGVKVNQMGISGEARLLKLETTEKIKKGVCKILSSEDSASAFFCTISIANENLFFLCTNNHVIDLNKLKSQAISCTLFDGSTLKISNSARSFTFSQPYDVTFVELSQSERYTLEVLKQAQFLSVLRDTPALANRIVNVIQHANGAECQLSQGTVRYDLTLDIRYTNDTFPGSSGSPVTDNDGLVVAVHKHSLPRLNLNGALKMAVACEQLEAKLQSSGEGHVHDVSYEAYVTYRRCCSATLVASIEGSTEQVNKRGFLAVFDKFGEALYGVFLATNFQPSLYENRDIILSCTFCNGDSDKLVCSVGGVRVAYDGLMFLEVPHLMVLPDMTYKRNVAVLRFTAAKEGKQLHVAYWDGKYDKVTFIPQSNCDYTNDSVKSLNMKYPTFGKTEFLGAPICTSDGNLVAVCNVVGKGEDNALTALNLGIFFEIALSASESCILRDPMRRLASGPSLTLDGQASTVLLQRFQRFVHPKLTQRNINIPGFLLNAK